MIGVPHSVKRVHARAAVNTTGVFTAGLLEVTPVGRIAGNDSRPVVREWCID